MINARQMSVTTSAGLSTENQSYTFWVWVGFRVFFLNKKKNIKAIVFRFSPPTLTTLTPFSFAIFPYFGMASKPTKGEASKPPKTAGLRRSKKLQRAHRG
jgi:hypothetical protein